MWDDMLRNMPHTDIKEWFYKIKLNLQYSRMCQYKIIGNVKIKTEVFNKYFENQLKEFWYW
jgi:hypothetical protein